MSAASIVAEVGCQPVSAQTIHRTLHQIGLHGCCPRRKPLLKIMHKKSRKQFAEDKQTKVMDYWNHVRWSDETKIHSFGSDGVKHVWRQLGEEYKDKCVLATVKHGGGSVMVWGCMSAVHMYCDILKQSIIPSLRRLGRRAVFQHDNDHCLAKEAEGKGDGLANHVSTLKPYWASVGRKRTPVATCEALVNSKTKRVKAVLENNGGHTKYWQFGPNLDIFT